MRAVTYDGQSAIALSVYESPRIAHFLAQSAVTFLLIVSILAPVVTISDSLPWFRVEQLALAPIGIVYLWLLLAGMAAPVRINALFLIAPIYCACILLSLFYGTLVLGHAFLYRDLYEIPKAVLPVVFFTLGLEARIDEVWIRRFLLLFSIAIVLVCLYAWAQWMNLGISYQLSQIYSGGAHDDGALAHYRRVYSTMGNPNLLGQLMTWSISAFMLAALFRVGNRLLNFCLVAICLVTLAMTGSRYGLLDTALAFLLIFSFSASVRHRRRTLIVFLLVLLPVFAGIVFAVAKSNQATLERFQSLRDPVHTDSFEGRMDMLWPDASKQISESPFLGHGPAKAIFSDIVTDSEYLDVLKEFGIVGFCAYLAYFIYPLRIMWRGFKIRKRCDARLDDPFPASSLALQLSFLMLVTGLVMNIGMSTFYADPIQGFFWLWMGIGVSIVHKLYGGPASI
jgi:O-antigen ligase